VRLAVRIVLVLIVLLGLVWIGQGANLIKGSFMTGHVEWSIIGAVISAVAVLALWFTARPRAN
jgi:hypothetical protein